MGGSAAFVGRATRISGRGASAGAMLWSLGSGGTAGTARAGRSAPAVCGETVVSCGVAIDRRCGCGIAAGCGGRSSPLPSRDAAVGGAGVSDPLGLISAIAAAALDCTSPDCRMIGAWLEDRVSLEDPRPISGRGTPGVTGALVSGVVVPGPGSIATIGCLWATAASPER